MRVLQSRPAPERSLLPLFGVLIGMLFAAIFFNPFTGLNIDFAMRTDPAMFPTRPVDMSWLALVYFGAMGLLLGGGYGVVSRGLRFRRGSLVVLIATFGATFVITAGLIYGGLRLFNPALECMIESCNTSFVLQYALVTLAVSGVFTFSTQLNPTERDPNTDEPNFWDKPPGCFPSGRTLVTAGLVMIGTGLVLWICVLLAYAPRGTC